MKKNTKTIKIEVSKFPPIIINKKTPKLNVNVKKLEGVFEIEGKLATNFVVKKILNSLSEESIELKITEIEKPNKEIP